MLLLVKGIVDVVVAIGANKMGAYLDRLAVGVGMADL